MHLVPCRRQRSSACSDTNPVLVEEPHTGIAIRQIFGRSFALRAQDDTFRIFSEHVSDPRIFYPEYLLSVPIDRPLSFTNSPSL